MLLEDNVMYIFSTDSPTQETQLGNLTLDSATEVSYRSGNHTKGFKFQLHTRKRLNQFRAKKSSERELWRGYLMGISKGTVPDDLDLLDTEVTKIQRDVAAFHNAKVCEYDPKRSSIASENSMQSKIDSGVVSLGPTSRISGSSSSGDSKSRITNASAYSSASGGPTMVHKFYNDHNREQAPPSWFQPHCSREQAEKILEQAVSLNYGNTMMRESTSHLSNGSYVISKMTTTSNGSVDYDHYEVIRTARGYQIKVQNEHEPMRCLHDVMEYFIDTSGRGTRPLTVNDLKRLGQDTPGYATQIFKRQDTLEEPWRWPPSDPNGTEPVPAEVYANYDQSTMAPNHGRHQDRPGREIEGSQTLSPGILRKLPSQSSLERKSVGWSSVVNTPPPLPQHRTFAGTRTNHSTPSMSELAQRTREADQLNKLDTVISGFERSSIYANTPLNDIEEIQTQKRSGSGPLQHVQVPPAPPPPPPPAPHVIGKKHSYANQDTTDHALAALPVAPPAPRHPIVSSPTATTSNIRYTSSFSSPSKPSTQSPAHSVQLRKSATPSSIASSTAQRQQVSKSMSESQLRSATSPNSPRNFPVWETNKQNITMPNRSTRVANQTNKLEVFNEAQITTDLAEAGVDEHTPGGVSTLRNKFEGTANTSATPQKQVARSASLRHPTSSTDIQRYTHDNRQRRSTVDEDLYDDTGLPQQPTGLEKGRLNPEFKNKLEDLFGGVGAGTVAGNRARTSMGPIQRQFSYEDHEYQELPDIVPDEVTYLNDRFNVDRPDNK